MALIPLQPGGDRVEPRSTLVLVCTAVHFWPCEAEHRFSCLCDHPLVGAIDRDRTGEGLHWRGKSSFGVNLLWS